MEQMYSRLVSAELYPAWLDQESIPDTLLQSILPFCSYNHIVMIKTRKGGWAKWTPSAVCSYVRKNYKLKYKWTFKWMSTFSMIHAEKHPLQRNRLVAKCVRQLRLCPMEPCSYKIRSLTFLSIRAFTALDPLLLGP